MTTSFDLTSEPWIPVVTTEEKVVELSLRDVLARADDIVCLADEMPPSWLGTMRLLVAVLQRSVGPKDDADWSKTLVHGWDQTKVDAYLEAWRHRFDLFHPERPFYQSPDVEANVYPAVKLTLAHAVGKYKCLMDWSRDERPVPLSPGEAARALLGHQAMALGGGQSEPFAFTDAPCAATASFVPCGRSLRATLAMNLLAPEAAVKARGEDASGEDVPSWEWEVLPEAIYREKLTHAERSWPAGLTKKKLKTRREEFAKKFFGRHSRGYLDFLTWSSRQVRFEPPVGGVVLQVQNRQGHVATDHGNPWGCLAAKDKNLRVEEVGHPGWFIALKALAGKAEFRPLTLEQAARSGITAPDVAIRAVGICHDKVVIKRLYNDEIQAPPAMLLSPVDEHRQAIQIVEKAASMAAKSMTKNLLEAQFNGRNPDMGTKTRLGEQARYSDAIAKFWAAIKPHLLNRLRGETDDATFKGVIDKAAWRARREFGNRLGTSTQALIGAAKSGL